jgi:TolB-like protein
LKKIRFTARAVGIKMIRDSRPSIQIDLNKFMLHLQLKGRNQFTLHFNSPSRSFYLSVIALVVNEMKKSGKIRSIPLQEYLDLLALLNESIGGAAGSSEKENLLPRIYRKWKNALPNLEGAPLFKVVEKKKEEEDEAIGKVYSFTEVEKDGWANLFDYMGSEKNVRLKFAIDKIGVGLNEISIIFGESRNGEAWEQFISSLKSGTVEVASVDRMKYPLPDRPSIAVLPFVNMSGDPKQEFLCDGVTDILITALSKVPNLFVISRQSTFFFKGKPVRFSQVGEELGVRYVLEGSLQRFDDRVRIAAQLIDALTGYHLWAERYDRDLQDIFALQDEITMKIITALQVKLTAGEMAHVIAKGTKNLDAFIKYMQAIELLEKATKEGNAQCRKILEEAIALDPEYSRLYMGLAWTHITDLWNGTTDSPAQSLGRALELAQKAISLDDSNAAAYSALGNVYAMKRQYDQAIAECKRAVSLDPNSTDNFYRLGIVLNWAGRAEEAVPYLQKAIRLNPLPPALYFIHLAVSYRDSGQYEKAIEASKKALQLEPSTQFPYIHMAVSYIRLGLEKEARAAAAEIVRINPEFSLERYAKILPFPQPVSDRVVEDLRKAGLK